MGFTPKEKCKKCAMFYDTGNFCAHLTPEELENLSNESRTATLKRGESFEGEALEHWPIVAISSGVLSLQHLLEDGRKSIATFFMRGDVIDLRRAGQRNRGSLIALSKAEVCRLSVDAFETIADTNHSAQHVIWDNLREQSFLSNDHAADLATKQALEKLASFLFECRYRGSTDLPKQVISIPIRRCDMAEYMGMQPETISRGFRQLEEMGILHMQDLKTVVLENEPALRRIANGARDISHITADPKAKIKILSFG